MARLRTSYAEGKMNKIPHKVYNHLRWVNKESDGHVTVQLGISLNKEGYHMCGKELPGATQRQDANLRAKVDSRSMATCMRLGQMSLLEIKRRDLLIPEMNMKAANETGIHVVGVTFLEIKGRVKKTKQMVCVVKEMDYILLSQEAC